MQFRHFSAVVIRLNPAVAAIRGAFGVGAGAGEISELRFSDLGRPDVNRDEVAPRTAGPVE